MNNTTVEAASAFSSCRGKGCVRPLPSSATRQLPWTRWDGAIASCRPPQIDNNPCVVMPSAKGRRGEEDEHDKGSAGKEHGSELQNRVSSSTCWHIHRW